MHGQHDDFGVKGTRNFARCFKATDTGHVHIHQHHIGGVCAAPFYGIFATARLTGNFNTFYIFKNASYPCAHQFVVINKKDVDQRKCLQNRDNATE
jgi:hypothetical protein